MSDEQVLGMACSARHAPCWSRSCSPSPAAALPRCSGSATASRAGHAAAPAPSVYLALRIHGRRTRGRRARPRLVGPAARLVRPVPARHGAHAGGRRCGGSCTCSAPTTRSRSPIRPGPTWPRHVASASGPSATGTLTYGPCPATAARRPESRGAPGTTTRAGGASRSSTRTAPPTTAASSPTRPARCDSPTPAGTRSPAASGGTTCTRSRRARVSPAPRSPPPGCSR